VLKLALSYATVNLKNRWLLIPTSGFIFVVRVVRFGHVGTEIQLAIIFFILMILSPKTKYDHWEFWRRKI
jgi:hypothetical protein